jgi:hypothetical protein
VTQRWGNDWYERETLWWCFKRQTRIVGGWKALVNPFVLLLVLDSARELQAEIKEWHAVSNRWADENERILSK